MSKNTSSSPVEAPKRDCAPVSAVRDFWNPETLDELAEAKEIDPIGNLQELLGGWPGEMDDGFEEKIREIRKSSLAGI